MLFMAVSCFGLMGISQNPGDMDVTFNANDNGFIHTVGADNVVNALAVQSDGKYLIAGSFTSWNGTPVSRIARINTDASVDLGFNTGGTGIPAGGILNALAVQPDGKILIGGTFTEYNGTSVGNIARLNADGTLDNTFSTGTGFGAVVDVIKLQTDGKILVGGNFTAYDGTTVNRLVRLDSNGSLDATFSVGTGANNRIYALAVQSDGKILIGGNFTDYNGTAINRVARLESSGAIDATFATAIGTGASSILYNIVLQTDGKILLLGNIATFNGTTVGHIVRLNTDGSRDIIFNSGGTGFNSMTRAAHVLSDGKILVGGQFGAYNGTLQASQTARLLPNGDLDAIYTGELGASAVYALAVQSDGKVLIGGTFAGPNNLVQLSRRFARLNSDGSLDNTFNSITGLNSNATVTIVQPDGKVLVGGQFTRYFGQKAGGIVRLNADGSIDNGFAAAIGTGLGGTSLPYPLSMILQPDGKIVLGGAFRTFDDDTVNNIVRLNADGSRDYTFNTGTGSLALNGNLATVNSVALQADGKILLTGTFAKFNEDTINRLVRLNPDGSRDLSFNAGGTGFTSAGNIGAVTTDANGNIYITSNSSFYNGISLVQRRIARLFPDGTLDESFTIGTIAGSGGGSLGPVVPLPDGGVLAGSSFLATITQSYAPYQSTVYNVRGPVKFFSDGRLDTTFTGGVSNPGINTIRSVQSLLRQTDGRIIFSGTLTTYNGETVNHIGRLMPDGSLDQSFSSGIGLMGYGEVNSIWDVALYPDHKLVIAGNFGAYNETGRNNVARIYLGPSCSPDTGVDVRYICEPSFTWIDGNVYTADNDVALHTLMGASRSGCDSTVRLNLTFIQPATGTDTQTMCGQPYFQWINGVVYIADNNTATHTIPGGAANGCDSTVTLNLRFVQSATGIDEQSVCALSYTWIDNIEYTTNNNTATHTIFGGAANGCDSVVTLNLKLGSPVSSVDVQNICGGTFTWIDGVEYTANNTTATYTVSAGALGGCDSVVTLNLTLNAPSAGVDVQNVCGGTFTWINGVQYTADNTTATHTITGGAQSGCDSVVTLALALTDIDVSVAVNGATLTANQSGAAYQWVDCGNGNTPITGATSQLYTATANGSYSVIVTEGSCSETSVCQTVNTVNIAENTVADNVTVFPNPATDVLNISAPQGGVYRLMDLTGRVLRETSFQGGTASVDVSMLPAGVYVVGVVLENETASVHKIVKK